MSERIRRWRVRLGLWVAGPAFREVVESAARRAHARRMSAQRESRVESVASRIAAAGGRRG